jgi:hypothetical protein
MARQEPGAADPESAFGVPPAYVVEPERDSDLWLLRVRGRPELRTEVHDLRIAAAMVRDLIATFDDVPPDSFSLTVAAPKG